MIIACWVMVTMVKKDMHSCVSIDYKAALRGPGCGYGMVMVAVERVIGAGVWVV